jgi:hypothetical protein
MLPLKITVSSTDREINREYAIYSRSYASQSIDVSSDSNSYFTKYIIRGLKGFKPSKDRQGRIIPETGSIDNNGNVTPELLHRYVSYNVRHEIPQQQPVIKGSLAGDNIILAEHPELVSARYVYEKGKRILGYSGDTGMYLMTAVTVIQNYGVPLEKNWPYEPGDADLPKGISWDELDKMTGKTRALVYPMTSVNEIPVQLNLRRPIIAGVRIYGDSWDNINRKSEIPYLKTDQAIGDQAITIVGYDSKEWIMVVILDDNIHVMWVGR